MKPCVLALVLLGPLACPAGAQTSTPALTRHIEAAQEAQAHQDCAAAAKEYAAAVRLLPSNGELRTNYGIALYCTNDFAEAARVLRQALATSPQLAVPHLFLGLSAYHLGDNALATQELEVAVRRMPDDITGKLWLGYSYLAAHRNQDAIARFNEVLRLQPGNVDARYALGETYFASGRSEARELARLAPQGRGMELLIAQERALANGTIVKEDPPGAKEWRSGEERLYNDALADERNARAALQTVLDEAPDSDRAHAIQGDAFSLQRDNEAAIREYQAALAKNTTLPGLRLALANCLMQTEQFQAALAVLQQEQKLQPHSAEVWTSMGRVQLALGQDTEAVQSLQAAITSPERPPAALLLMGRAQLRLGHAKAAVPFLEEALHTGADPSTTNYLLARAYRSTGDRAAMGRALEAYHRVSIDETQRRAALALTADPKAVPDGMTAEDVHEAAAMPNQELHQN